MSNSILAAVLEKAKELDVPKEIVERNIKRASEKGQEAFIEKFYEVGIDFVKSILCCFKISCDASYVIY